MSPEKGSPQDWLIHAESDLQLAATGKLPKVLYETLCFHAQQAAEKAVKAVLIANSVPSTKTHNIGSLIGMLPTNVVFPGDLEPVTEDEYLEALSLAEKVINWAKDQIN